MQEFLMEKSGNHHLSSFARYVSFMFVSLQNEEGLVVSDETTMAVLQCAQLWIV